MVTIKMAALSNKIEMPQSLIDENIHALLCTIDYYYTYSSISYDDNNAWSKLLRSVDVLLSSLEGEDIIRVFCANHKRKCVYETYKALNDRLVSSRDWFSNGEDFCVTRFLQQVIQDIVVKFGPFKPMPKVEQHCLSHILDYIYDYSSDKQLITFFKESEMDVGEIVEYKCTKLVQ